MYKLSNININNKTIHLTNKLSKNIHLKKIN